MSLEVKLWLVALGIAGIIAIILTAAAWVTWVVKEMANADGYVNDND